MDSLDALLPIAVRATAIASRLMRQQGPGALTPKGDRDFASEVDLDVERALRSFLTAETPDIGFLGEEEGSTRSEAERQWILDPIDGTVNFTRALPLCGVSLALVEAGKPVIGVIELPFLGNLYTAVQGRGAYLDRHPIRASSTTRLRDAVISIGDYGVGEAAARNPTRLALTSALAKVALRLRLLGSAAVDLAWLAAGITDATIFLSNKPWDTAAGVIIAREAGAVVADLDGTDHTIDSSATVAAAPGIIDDFLEVVQAAVASVEGVPGRGS
jgi:myo-inositol-1(or 4)-monophosphatase